MSLLVPDSGLLFWMVLSFGIVFFVLAKFGFPIITKMVDERKQYIDHSLIVAKEAFARQPEAAGDIRMSMIIIAALMEGVALFAIVVCFLAL